MYHLLLIVSVFLIFMLNVFMSVVVCLFYSWINECDLWWWKQWTWPSNADSTLHAWTGICGFECELPDWDLDQEDPFHHQWDSWQRQREKDKVETVVSSHFIWLCLLPDGNLIIFFVHRADIYSGSDDRVNLCSSITVEKEGSKFRWNCTLNYYCVINQSHPWTMIVSCKWLSKQHN